MVFKVADINFLHGFQHTFLFGEKLDYDLVDRFETFLAPAFSLRA
jgi:hypothetical protein